jgi:hypothetical protein
MFLQIYTNHVINLTRLVKNTGTRSCKFSHPCERKTREGVPSKFLVIYHINNLNTQQMPVEMCNVAS